MNRLHPSRHIRFGSATLETLLVFPVLLIVVLGGLELGLLIHARHQLWGACREVGRRAALGQEPAQLRATLEQYLGPGKSVDAELSLLDEQGRAVVRPAEIPPGAPVTVVLRLPATSAAPDLLRWVGFSLQGQILEVHTVWRRE
ncbi:MAG: TadE/TadG family type IV pilus assembly protein [Gemmatales bacterium]|nr:pilus assembly protein [Gemmatales bacterium]MDW7994470.1 TadE/TadG family type IV pilus assembly protein [Gemmatales bacterium]